MTEIRNLMSENEIEFLIRTVVATGLAKYLQYERTKTNLNATKAMNLAGKTYQIS